MVHGGTVLYVGKFEILVKEVVDVLWKWGIVLIVVEGGFCIWNCEFCIVGVNVLDVCGGRKVFKNLVLLLFVEDCCV